MKRILPHALSLFSALLVVFAFPPWNAWPLIFIALIPLFWALDQTPSLRGRLGLSLLWGMAMSVGGMWWVGPTIVTFGELPSWTAPILVLLMSTIAEAQALFTFPFRPWFRKMRWGGFAFALFYATLDAWIPKLWKDTLGHVFHASPPLLQWAEVGSAPLLTLFAVWINELLYDAIKSRKLRPALTALAAFLIAFGFGKTRLEDMRIYENAKDHPHYSIASIQANIEDYQKVAAERGFFGAGDTILNTYLSLSRSTIAHTPQPDWIIWPETAFPFLFRTPETEFEKKHVQGVRNFVETYKIPVGFGGYDLDPNTHETFNSIYFLNADQSLEVYHKHHLLMFGEYLPFADWFPSIKTWIPNIGFFGKGPGPVVRPLPLQSLEGRPLHVGPTICYEALIADYSIESVRMGAELLLNVTNDGWFGDTGEPYHHLAQARFRSVETRTPFLRVTNTGISALILPSGDLVDPTPVGAIRATLYDIPILPPPHTLVLEWGNWVPWLGCLLLALMFFIKRLKI